MPTCAVASYRLPLHDWSLLAPGKAQRDFYDFPKNIS
jgi:hypothetical protein